LGILAAFLAALVVLPALALVMERLWPWRVPPAVPSPPPGAPIAARRFPILSLGTLLMCLILATVGAVAVPQVGFEYNLGKLGAPNRATPEQQRRAGEYRDAVGRTQSSDPTILLTDDLAQ